MRRADLHYNLPRELIATRPVEPRDASRLLVLHRATGTIEHRIFREIADYLRPHDCLVLNNTRVIPARFFCRRPSGGRVEALFLSTESDPTRPASRGPTTTEPERAAWRVLLKASARLREHEQLLVLDAEGRPASPHTALVLAARLERGEWVVRPVPERVPFDLLAKLGEPPLPPYILHARQAANPTATREPILSDRERYQTVYAAVPGAVAAPTAGLHFTPAVLERLSAAGIRRADVTLHVGLGTFQPIEADDLSDHRMHAEHYAVASAALDAIAAARAGGGRIFAVGTTSARVLETIAESGAPADGWTKLFIQPPYAFRNVDALLTNFHLPESTLLALVMAFASPDQIRTAYAAAVAEKYRFYSYGDAMLIV